MSATSLSAVRGRMSSRTHPEPDLPTIAQLSASFPKRNVSQHELPHALRDLHVGLSKRLTRALMRLLRIPAVLRWASGLKVYEDVEPSECIDLPYEQVTDEQWASTMVLSWRWGAPKPPEKDYSFSPMLGTQLSVLRETLQQAVADGFQYLWVDWSCVPQYSAPSMVEVLRSKVFYTRARAMVVLPTFSEMEGIVKVLLSRAGRILQSRLAAGGAAAASDGAMTPAEAAAAVLANMEKSGEAAGREYFSRIWTLVERMARFGRGERLKNWMSLETWLGMLADAMCRSTDDPAASKIYKKILGPEASALLESILAPLADALETSSAMVASEDFVAKVADLFVLGASIWAAPAKLEEAPSTGWLLSYLEEFSSGVYNCFSDTDRIWALYSYFCWKQLHQDSDVALATAVKDLVRVAGGTDKHLVAVAARLGLKGMEETESKLREDARRRQAADEEARRLQAADDERLEQAAAAEARRQQAAAEEAEAAQRSQQKATTKEYQEWSSGLYDCTDDCCSCLLTCLFPPLQFCLNLQKLSSYDGCETCCSCCCCMLLTPCCLCGVPHSSARDNVRWKYNIRYETSCCMSCCCILCAICQEARQLKS